MTTTYTIGNVLGRATDVEQSSEPAAAPAAPAASTAPTPTGPPAAGGKDDPVPVAAEIEPGVAVPQPVTGPGRPPLPMEPSGPYGTRRTTGDAYVALTFDDGPDPKWTPEVLELLREHRVLATFCVVGQMVVEFPELVKDIAEDGHTLCNHTWNHDVGLGSRSRAKIREDLERTNEAIRAAAPGARISYYRQPGGAWTQRVVEVAAELGMSSLHWAVDPQDWSRPGAAQIAHVVSAGTDDGEIVLLHDGGGERQGTVRALARILPKLADRHKLAALPPGVDPPRRHGLGLPLKPSQR